MRGLTTGDFAAVGRQLAFANGISESQVLAVLSTELRVKSGGNFGFGFHP
jgi:hypothetical protein